MSLNELLGLIFTGAAAKATSPITRYKPMVERPGALVATHAQAGSVKADRRRAAKRRHVARNRRAHRGSK